jgi:hypothetical protein
MSNPIGSGGNAGPVWSYPPNISSPATPATSGRNQQSVPLTDLDPPKAGPFGLAPSDVAVMSQYSVRLNAVDSLKNQAKAAGLKPDEVKALGDYLFSLSKTDFGRESSLVRDALKSDNAGRAMGTYVDLISARNASPKRITPDIVRDLVRGVGTSATGNHGGHKGVIGRHQAAQAAATLSEMSDSDYKSIAGALAKTGKGGTAASSAENEGALILKAVAARRDAFSDPKSGALNDVLRFADHIRGKPRSFNVSNTSLLAIDNQSYGLQQHWNNSCAPAAAEMLKGDTDPIYSLQMNTLDTPHSTGLGLFSVGEGLVLMANGQIPGNGGGMTLEPALNAVDEPVTHRTYKPESVDSTPAGRAAAVNRLESLLDQGIDVPIRVEWANGGGHFQVLSDVQGKAPNRQFLLNDPFAGVSAWVTETDIATSPNSVFLAKLTTIYPGTDEPRSKAQMGK